jgi:ABC-type oligopeptide transport system ATPase subunit
MTALLEVEDLVVEYPVHRGVFRAVDSVSFSVEAGRTLAIVGESGCGKSTIARSIVRLLTPTSGRILLDGVDIARMPERRFRPLRSRVQMVFQDPYGSLDPHLTAEQIVAEAVQLRGGAMSRSERSASAAQFLDQVGLDEKSLHRRPHEFSGGQRQRIGIARALASKPELIVLDEATSALDVSVQAEILKLLGFLQANTGVTFIVISHNLGVVREISDTVVVMSKGEILERGDTRRVLEAPEHPYTRALRAAALDPSTMRGIKPREALAAVRVAKSLDPSHVANVTPAVLGAP